MNRRDLLTRGAAACAVSTLFYGSRAKADSLIDEVNLEGGIQERLLMYMRIALNHDLRTFRSMCIKKFAPSDWIEGAINRLRLDCLRDDGTNHVELVKYHDVEQVKVGSKIIYFGVAYIKYEFTHGGKKIQGVEDISIRVA